MEADWKRIANAVFAVDAGRACWLAILCALKHWAACSSLAQLSRQQRPRLSLVRFVQRWIAGCPFKLSVSGRTHFIGHEPVDRLVIDVLSLCARSRHGGDRIVSRSRETIRFK